MVVTHLGNDDHVMPGRGEKRPYERAVEATTLKSSFSLRIGGAALFEVLVLIDICAT